MSNVIVIWGHCPNCMTRQHFLYEDFGWRCLNCKEINPDIVREPEGDFDSKGKLIIRETAGEAITEVIKEIKNAEAE